MRKQGRIESYNKLSREEFKAQLMRSEKINLLAIPDAYTITLETISTINTQDLDVCFNLIASTSKADYEQSMQKWRPRAKKAEMCEPDMKYLLLRAQDSAQILGFASFMLTYEDGFEVIYLYEIHLDKDLRGLGFGNHLINIVSQIGCNAKVKKMMLTVFNRNVHAVEWYARLGFSVDEFSPTARTLRNGIVKVADYCILSKNILEASCD